jgi:hypothetical protein
MLGISPCMHARYYFYIYITFSSIVFSSIMFGNGKRRVTISIGLGFGFEVGYAIRIYLKLNMKSCPVLLSILKLSKQFMLLIITYLFS